VGWTDASDDGEFCVALRCALLSGSVARCYAGVGVVRDSDPASELAETETKLQALLPVLT
jgi:salicylate biosynthesis isochorismate synthase/menaquinone-specific isochorismate synthase